MIGERVTGGGNIGVSPVVGIILMVALTVVLVAVIATFLMGVGSNTQDFVSAGVTVEIVSNHNNNPSDGQYIMIQVVNLGNTDRIWVQGDSADKWLVQNEDCNYETQVSDYLLFPVPQDEGFTIYAETDDGDLQVIQTEAVDSSGDTSGSYLTGCEYGDESRGTLYSEFHG